MAKKEKSTVKASAPPAVAAKVNADKKSSKKVKEGVPPAPAPFTATKEKKKSKKKEPTPPPALSESSSDEEEEEDESSDEESSEEDQSSEDEKVQVSAVTPAEDDSSDSEGESDSDDEPSKAQGVKTKPAGKEESDDESSDESDEEPSAPAKDAESEEDSDDSDDDEEDELDEEEDKLDVKPEVNGHGKRKADQEAQAPAKKSRTDGEAEPTANVYVGGLSWNVDNEWLASEFQSCGEVVEARVMFDHQNQKSKGFGFVRFKTAEEAAKAVAMTGHEIDGRAIRCDFAAEKTDNPVERRAQKFNDQRSAPAATLYLGGLSYDLNEDAVYEAFGDFGDIQRVSLPTDRETGAPKGFGYVEFADVDQATAALEAMNGKELSGRRIRVDYSGPKPDREGGGGGGRGGFRGGRGGGRGGFGGDRGYGGDRGGRGGRGGGRGGFGDRGGGRGGGRGRGAPRGGARTGGIVPASGSKMTFD
ncbi:hypothetical protein M231_00210 [Tremella mesenterica]|uniref:RRM domain-containing protein n=1 Tax=Tremella mesenterica TaxID=5217 RepID=A0A4Q1BWU1_TREME|nr:hypothetical protein M231_00210 [Tremella mesenterica]